MAQISCGCTPQRADATCERGSKLFAAASHAFQDIIRETATTAYEKRQAYTLAHLAYIDHLHGWWEGDRKVLRRMDTWIVYVRLSGRWMFHFETKDDTLLKEWLRVKGYQQFVKGGGKQAQDHLSGYYRKIEGAIAEDTLPLSLSPEQMSDPGISSEYSERLVGLEVPSPLPFSSHIDLKTRVTVFITLLVARIPHSFTLVDRLHIQQRATHLLRTYGIPIGPRDDQALRALIDEAIQQNEEMKASSRRNTQALQE